MKENAFPSLPPLEIFSDLFPLFKQGVKKKMQVNETIMVKMYIFIYINQIFDV